MHGGYSMDIGMQVQKVSQTDVLQCASTHELLQSKGQETTEGQSMHRSKYQSTVTTYMVNYGYSMGKKG